MKKTLLAVLCGGLILSSAATAKNLVIGAPRVSFADKWQTYLQDAIRDFDAKHDDVEIKLSDANADPARQLNDVETFIDQKVDGKDGNNTSMQKYGQGAKEILEYAKTVKKAQKCPNK